LRIDRTLVVLSLLLAASGCATYRAYEGPGRPSSEVAIIHGDAKVRAFSPVALVIRVVDGQSVDARYSSVALLPGEHDLLVDCQVGVDAATSNTSRFDLKVTLAAGERYRLREELEPGRQSCKSVNLDPA